jgi:ABC-type lipoprotein export system ATPase subunit
MRDIILNVKELGAIKNSKIHVKPLMIISGESGLGKSYLATLIHYVYKILAEQRLQDFFIKNHWDYESLAKINASQGVVTFNSKSLISWINKDAKEYMQGAVGNSQLNFNTSIDLPGLPEKFVMSYKTESMGLVGKEKEYLEFTSDDFLGGTVRIPADTKEIGAFPWTLMLQQYLSVYFLENDEIDQTIALVPGRGALLNIPLTIQDKIKNGADIFAEFLKDWDIVRSMDSKKNTNEELVQLLRKINGGSIVLNNDKKVFYRMNNGKDLPLSASASSVKELAPLDVLLAKYPAEGVSILFEEPEAHVHPSKQVAIADFIIQAVNKGAHMQITTHSDYFLRRINDRIFLHEIKKHDEKQYEHIIGEYGYSDLSVDPELIGAYLLKREDDGTVRAVSQTLDKGIPYESFYSVLTNDIGHSLDIQFEYNRIKDAE